MIRLVLFFSFAFSNLNAFAQNKTPNYWKCQDRVSGSWKFGVAPSGCNASTFGEDNYVYDHFSTLVFEDQNNPSSETQSYMENLYSVLRDIARYYYSIRKPQAPPEEIQAWVHAVFAMAHQESFWSHYRQASDGKLKQMRGDYGHGHGLVQVDDRWHFVEVNQGIGWDIIQNLKYGLEQFYSGWEKIKSQSCYSRTPNWENQARGAYSYYNGGPSKTCRWSNPGDRWAQNDRGYLEKYQGQTWQRYISDTEKPAPINSVCYFEENFPCETQEGDDSALLPGINYAYKGQICIVSEQKFKCLEGTRNLACMVQKYAHTEYTLVELSDEQNINLPIERLNRHDVCPQAIEGIYPVGSFITVNKNINVRQTPGGGWISTTAKGDSFQVLDFQINPNGNLERYYLIKSNDQYGYVYAGSDQDWNNWVSTSTQNAPESTIPTPMQKYIELLQPTSWYDGRFTEPQGSLTAGTIFSNEGLTVIGDENQVYIQTKIDQQDAFIYLGQTRPQVNVASFYKESIPQSPIESPTMPQTFHLTSDQYYRYLKTCADIECKNTEYWAIGKKLEDLCSTYECDYKEDSLEKIEQQNEWIKVKIIRSGATGWINSNSLEAL